MQDIHLLFALCFLYKSPCLYPTMQQCLQEALEIRLATDFNTKEMISNSFLAKSEQLSTEYNNLVTSKENLEKELKKF